MTDQIPPKTESINSHCRRRGIGRSKTYEDVATGNYRAIRYGAKTLIDVESADRYFASLPAWKPKAPKKAEAAKPEPAPEQPPAPRKRGWPKGRPRKPRPLPPGQTEISAG